MITQKIFTPTTVILFLGYVLLLAYFNFIDVYHHDFFTTGFTVVAYNLFRCFFIFYLIWLFYAAGDLFLGLMLGNSYRTAMTLENTLLAFFSGVGLWHIVLLFIGFAGFYTRTLMALMTLLVFAVSLPRLTQWVQWVRFSQSKLTPFYWRGWLVLLIPMVLFLLTKGLYPAGGHDYYNHYFPYYLKVVESGSILPNEVWYHFYYSKGDALFFLSMLLTDPLAPQLATTALMIAGAAMIFSLLKKSAQNWPLLPWIGAALYITFLIYTPGPQRQEGWADLEKAHEPASVLMLAMLWVTIGLAKAQAWRKWGLSLIFSMSALVLINPFLAPIAGAYLFLATLVFYWRNKKTAALWLFAGMVVTGVWFIFLSAINYYLTGVPDEQKLLAYLPFINFQKVNHWGVVMEILKFHWDRTGMVANQLHLISGHFLHVYFTYIRLDIWGPLLLLACVLLGFNYYSPTRRVAMFAALDKTTLYTCGGFLTLVLLLSLVIGRDQAFSYYRFTIFSYAPMLCFSLLLIAAGLHQTKFATGVLLAGFIIAWLVLKPFMNFEIGKIQQVMTNTLRFATGQYSLADGYRNQQGWPGRMPWGAIYPGAEQVWAQLPPGTRIWSMHENSYCMLPGCRMETYPSYRFSPHSPSIFYSQPQAAKDWLKQEGLNYFFFSRSLNLTDPLPLAPLFSPTHIADYLGIAWTNGKDTLLTWKEQARYPIDASWLERYQQSMHDSRIIQSFPYDQIHTTLETLAIKSRLEKSDIPWYHSGWK